ncbi:dihydroorotate dehydrogenase electron transfer subunit [Gracilibacillus caseinilyticus]|uniref:Dihydroorotate dehydrogenase electron transfer subunit n=1 Tax=Gracilibacillus caseinilyticus TaxID=2932256 RepID=A0ABY4EXE2_9BACI|nr:dihydroorotate dehydrogenase electron transfer subunit [Gracilibacillus caseinilyticus]UOQ48928.1 dihydroorotate dehydrogenase electron transfer subunit [Gracilibacillus caseinilyticus]
MQRHQANVLSNKQVSNRYWHMVVDISELNIDVDPGQFFQVRCADTYFPFLRRPLSVYRINEDTIEFLYLVKGQGTSAMTKIQAGQSLDMMGPVGEGFSLDPSAGNILLVARGVGVATLAAVAQAACRQQVKCYAIMSARSRDDLLAIEFLEDYGAEVFIVTEEEGTSDVENVKRIIKEDICATTVIDAIYTCGSRRLSKLSQSIANELHIPGEIALEEHMGCGMGACFSCVCDIREGDTTKSVRVCTEGPVFPLHKVVME